MIMEIKLNDALDQLMKQVKEMEGQAVEALKEAIDIAETELMAEFKKGLERHEDTGEAVKSLFKHKVKIDGNEISGLVGSFYGKNGPGYIHAAYQEYGAFARKYGAVTFKADPWKRPAEEAMKPRFRQIVNETLKRRLKK